MTEHEPPHSPESEAALIGAVLWDTTQTGAATALVKPRDFYDRGRGRIWEVLTECGAKYPAGYDLTLVQAELQKVGPIDGITTATLVGWMSTTGGSACCPYYARVIAEHARTRRAIAAHQESEHDLLTAANPEEAMTRAAERMAEVTRDAAATDGTQLGQVLADLLSNTGKDGPEMIPIGLSAYDHSTGGWPRSGLLTVLGYPGSGKSTFVLLGAVNRAIGPVFRQPVRIYSIEMPAKRIAATILTNATGISVHNVIDKGGSFTHDQQIKLGEVAIEMGDKNIWLAPRIYNAPEIYAQCAAAHAKHGPACVVIDYAQDLPGFDVFKEERVRIAESMRVLAAIARDFDWLVVVVSQLDKATGKLNKRPTMFDGIGSAAIEQRSDMMVSIYREFQQEPMAVSRDTEQWKLRKRKCELTVLKQKYGSSMPVLMAFDGAKMSYTNPTMEEDAAWQS